jgi:acyl-CoA reductase-like NAD-dependent aldehyde dehydrogenase
MDTTGTTPLDQKMLVGGSWIAAFGGETLPVENPFDRSVIAYVPRARALDVDRAVTAAAAAFPAWRRIPPRERGRALLKIADIMEKETERLARLLATETGNAIRTQARPEIRSAIDIFRYFGGLGSEIKGCTLPFGEDVLSYTRREPIGVVGGIIAWNAPVTLASVKIAPALCAGNTIVLKAAEDAPLTVLAIAEIAQDFLPAGALNVLSGVGEEAGAALLSNPHVQKFSFTGSTEVGRLVLQAAATRIVPTSLELGGKNPCIVFPDADRDASVDGVIAAMRFTRQGQSCTAGSRLFLHHSIHDAFVDELVKKVSLIRLGNPVEEETDAGTLINAKQHSMVSGYVSEGLAQADARLLTGGLPPSEGPLSKGYFYEPTIFAGATNDWRIAREEVFGPVMVVIPWRDEDEVVKMANDTHYGLAAFVWGRDIAVALRTAHRLEAGWIQVNQSGGPTAGQSYGGYKQSGIGKEYSLEAMLDSYTLTKNVIVNLQGGPKYS